MHSISRGPGPADLHISKKYLLPLLVSLWALSDTSSGIIAEAGEDGIVQIRRIDTDRCEVILCRHSSPVLSITRSPDGTLLVSTHHRDPCLQFWDPATGSPAGRIPISNFTTSPPRIETVAWSSDGRYLAAGCQDGTVQIVDLTYRKHIHTYRLGPRQAISCLAWSPDGTYLAVGGNKGWNDGWVRIWQFHPNTFQYAH